MLNIIVSYLGLERLNRKQSPSYKMSSKKAIAIKQSLFCMQKVEYDIKNSTQKSLDQQ